jgi:hypothetical protein
MSVSESIPRAIRLGRSRPLVLIITVAALIALAAWAITSSVTGSPSKRPRASASGEAAVLWSLSAPHRQYVTAIASLNPATLAAAFGTDRTPSVDPALAKLTPAQRRYVQAIAAMSYRQLAAAFGTSRATAAGVR